MKKILKRATIMLGLFVLLAFSAIAASAADNVSGDWNYSISEGEATLTKYTGSSLEISIPSSIDGYPVTRIGSKLFYNSNITSLSIPETIEYIESRAFANCKYLTSIYFNAKNCDVYYFRSNMSLHVFANAGKFSDSLTVTFGSSVKYIPTCLFEADEDEYAHITSVVIPGNVETIGSYAFSNCYDLSSLQLNDGLLTINSYAFSNCQKLTTLTIPKTVTYIGAAAFANLKYLSELNFNAVNCKVYYFRSDMDSHAFVNAGKFSNSLTVNFGSGVKKIPASIFEAPSDSYAHITKVNIPDTVTKIEAWAFNNCYDLKEITVLSRTVTFPADSSDDYNYAFKNCPSSLVFKCYRGSTTAAFANSAGFAVSYLDKEVPISSCNISISNTKYVYNGKARKPAVTVTYNSINLAKGTDYTVSYENNKNVGTASIVIAGKGDYSGTVTKTFTIVPKSTKISKLIAKKKGFTIQIKKQSTQTTGYQIQYSLDKKFTSKTTKTVKGSAKTKITYKNLKSGRKYYVRVRTYKIVNNTKYYSAWSSVKTIKTK